MVIIHHIEMAKYLADIDSYYLVPAIDMFGGLGVTLFFVLSGYLITYLLLKEQANNTRINIKNFYIRRVLRIWPLYYFFVLLGFFVLPHFLSIGKSERMLANNPGYIKDLFYYIFFIPNVAYIMHSPVPFVKILWSVGVEEQFYLLWPWVMRYFRKNLPVILLIIILSLLSIRGGGHLLINSSLVPDAHNTIRGVLEFLYFFRIDCMAVGGIGAYVLFNKYQGVLNLLFNNYFQWMSLIVLSIHLILGINYPLITHTVYAVLFIILIMNVSANKSSILKLENKIFNYLGRISYGLYVYHSICIAIIMLILKESFTITNSILHNSIIYTSVLLLTIIFASLSYKFMELKFLKAKKGYTNITSGDAARNDHQ